MLLQMQVPVNLQCYSTEETFFSENLHIFAFKYAPISCYYIIHDMYVVLHHTNILTTLPILLQMQVPVNVQPQQMQQQQRVV